MIKWIKSLFKKKRKLCDSNEAYSFGTLERKTFILGPGTYTIEEKGIQKIVEVKPNETLAIDLSDYIK